MSRDHYQGVPKNIDARVNKNGEVVTLGKIPEDPAEFVNYVGVGAEEIIYVDADLGDDINNEGKTEEAPLKTIQKAFSKLKLNAVGLRQVIQIKGDFEVDETLVVPPINNVYGPHLDPNAPINVDGFYYTTNLEIRAKLDTVTELTVTGQTNDSITGFATVTVSDNLVEDAHVGYILATDGDYNHAGVIVSNTTNELFVVGSSSFDYTAGNAAIYKQGASIAAGDVNDFFNYESFVLPGDSTNISLIGIRFEPNQVGAPGLYVTDSGGVKIDNCHIKGGLTIVGNSGVQTTLDVCFIDGGALSIQRPSYLRSCFVKDMTWIGYETGALHNIHQSLFDSCSSVGHTHNHNNAPIQVDRCEIRNSTGIGMSLKGSNHSIATLRVTDSTSDGIRIVGPSFTTLTNVVGGGNGGFGVNLSSGAQVSANAGTTISGSSGEVSLGGSGATDWADAPATDVGAGNPQFCRIV